MCMDINLYHLGTKYQVLGDKTAILPKTRGPNFYFPANHSVTNAV